MNMPIDSLLARYNHATPEHAHQALRETVQHIALLGLWRAKFFEHAAFYGGTALRIVHGLPRFSEDMDFSLLTPNPDFSLNRFSGAIVAELTSYGFDPTVTPDTRKARSAIESAFVKMNTRQGLLAIGVPQSVVSRAHRDGVLKVKYEIDTSPPEGASTRTDFVFHPQSFSVRTYDLPSMFAGKVHAALARAWQGRVKGRDWYDLVWFAARGVAINTEHLRARLAQTGHLGPHDPFDAAHAREMLRERIRTLDFDAARRDVRPFIKDSAELEVWGADFFMDVAARTKFL